MEVWLEGDACVLALVCRLDLLLPLDVHVVAEGLLKPVLAIACFHGELGRVDVGELGAVAISAASYLRTCAYMG